MTREEGIGRGINVPREGSGRDGQEGPRFCIPSWLSRGVLDVSKAPPRSPGSHCIPHSADRRCCSPALPRQSIKAGALPVPWVYPRLSPGDSGRPGGHTGADILQ